jgi:hypothetical protein
VQTGIRPDALLIDYLDLLYPNSNKVDINSAFNKDKYVSEEMRALAFEWNIYISSASQLNRSAVNEQDYDMSHIAGGISKINTADNLMGIFSTTAMKERGEYQIQFLKTRSSSGVGSKVYLKYDPNSLRISDMEEGETTSHETGLANIQNQLQKHKIQQKIETPPANQSIGSNNLASMIRAAAARNND